MSSTFQSRDLGSPKFFLGIEIARSADGIYLSHKKYVLDLLESTVFLGCKSSAIPMEPNHKLSKDTCLILDDAKHYMKFVGKLQYLTITRPDIVFPVSKLSQYIFAPRDIHIQVFHKILRYLKRTIDQGLFYGSTTNFDFRGYS